MTRATIYSMLIGTLFLVSVVGGVVLGDEDEPATRQIATSDTIPATTTTTRVRPAATTTTKAPTTTTTVARPTTTRRPAPTPSVTTVPATVVPPANEPPVTEPATTVVTVPPTTATTQGPPPYNPLFCAGVSALDKSNPDREPTLRAGNCPPYYFA